MSTEQDELIVEFEAAAYLEVLPHRLREFASQGMLRSVDVQGPHGHEVMYYRSEVVRLRSRLREQDLTDEWPDIIGE